MAAPYRHAQSSAKRWGGKPEDYLPIHELMDSTKYAVADPRHRILTHNIWFCTNIIPKIFGSSAINSDNRRYIPKDVAELHCLEDYHFKFIPTLQDWVEKLPLLNWMRNGIGLPPSSPQNLLNQKQ